MTVADFANADPAVVKSGRVKKAVANAVEKEGKIINQNAWACLFYTHSNTSINHIIELTNFPLCLSCSEVVVWTGGVAGFPTGGVVVSVQPHRRRP